jgi:hypothetical protein
MAALAARGLQAKTINHYRWALHALHGDLGVPSILSGNQTIDRMLEGICKTLGTAPLKPPRMPITPTVLRALHPFLSADDPDHRMLRAAMWTACVGMLRPGEIGVESAKNPQRLLTVASLKLEADDPPRYSLMLAESKT